MTNAQLQEMARRLLANGLFNNETDPAGDIERGLEYIASDGEFDSEVIAANIQSIDDWDSLNEWAARIGEEDHA